MSSGFLPGPTAIKRRSKLPAPVPVAGAERVTNGDFASSSGWNVGTGWTISGGVLTGVAATGDVRRYLVGNRYDWATVSLGVSAVTGGGVTISMQSIVPALPVVSAPGTLFGTGLLVSTDETIYIGDPGGAFSGVVDNVSVKLFTLSSLFSSRTYASANCDLSVGITRTAATQAGLVARLDSASSPANFIVAYLDGTDRIRVYKCVAGVYSAVLNGAVTYGAGKVLRLVCSGNDVSCYYNGVQVGSTVTVSDAGIVSNTRHGLFSTYASNSFAGYVAA